MFGDEAKMVRAGNEGTCIYLDVDRPYWRRAHRRLETLGGHRFLLADGAFYQFRTEVERDEALHLVRREFGWTIVSRFDGGPWQWAKSPLRYSDW